MNKEEVSILRRMFPTKVIQWSLLALLGTPIASDKLTKALPMSSLSKFFSENQLLAFCVWQILIILVLILIIIDYALIFKDTYTHRKQKHLDNMGSFPFGVGKGLKGKY
ncbi:hypothetical protein [Desulfoluna sp.]|uniref:hypothetical protein n=1 Tax=Desulfoluna sp. TaxID=2045199 RepID=UPI00261700B2|nr:hypothetical protein [Desulfoluna sp.]